MIRASVLDRETERDHRQEDGEKERRGIGETGNFHSPTYHRGIEHLSDATRTLLDPLYPSVCSSSVAFFAISVLLVAIDRAQRNLGINGRTEEPRDASPEETNWRNLEHHLLSQKFQFIPVNML